MDKIVFQYKFNRWELIFILAFGALVFSMVFYLLEGLANIVFSIVFISIAYFFLSKMLNIFFLEENIIIERPLKLAKPKKIILKYDEIKSVSLAGRPVVIVVTDNTGKKSRFYRPSFLETIRLFTFLKNKGVKLINDTEDYDYCQRLVFDKIGKDVNLNKPNGKTPTRNNKNPDRYREK